MHAFFTPLKKLWDLIVTLLLWAYFTLGYVIFFAPFYILAYLIRKNPERAFQKLTHRFLRGFFGLLRLLIPRLAWRIPEEVRSIDSSVIVCNHLSYLDPIFFISLFEKQKTIVRSDFFSYPIFGSVIKTAGYLPSTTGDELSGLMIKQIERMCDYLASGGNLFIFPEGTRSRNGRIGPFNKGAFSIAARCRAPIKVLIIRNTHRLFPPGRFLFNTNSKADISVELIGSIETRQSNNAVSSLMAQVRSLFDKAEGGVAEQGMESQETKGS